DNGFVGTKPATNILECSRSNYEIFEVVSNKGMYSIRCTNGWWNTQADKTILTNGDHEEDFTFELCAHTRMCIVNKDGFSLQGEQSGLFKACGEKGKISMSTLWEY
ncbi:hypothetical protein, partial [Salmonella sp. s54836]|uniref:hypothetical protein n=1 Tax=Salmonella sp. s54836 TaxID=3159673 RepID=UPI00397F5A18